ncbi:MAG: MerR family transcriptional regulator [Candidatus Marinimicrobia bacterium]|nr:MerR family transcriptional regulator [Candidatus Neomarinimicrobiota bacterium]MDC3246652.1 MerR family transcriptional regulator [Candidatus Neomarinimicrobiota bacterium]
MSKVQPKVKKLYYSIGEVSELTDLKAYVLRYWETEFSSLKPPKNRAGNRTYRQKDIDVILEIKDLLYNQKFTIDGARSSILKVDEKQSSKKTFSEKQKLILSKIKLELKEILDLIEN